MQLDLLAALRTGLAGRYDVTEELGHGGMAVVCRARDLRHDREVAIKVLYPDLARAVGGERFLREIGILARLSHPNILPLLDSGTVELLPGLDIPWYAMPLVREETLRTRLQREGPLPVDQALGYTRDICAALQHAHAQGYIHRDIKPENILISGGQAVLADFGIARAVTVAGGGTLSSTGIVVGTPAYMSPEQSVGSPRLDGRSDLYSVGVVLYEMLAGHPPFTGATPQALSARHQFEQPPPIRVVRPAVPRQLDRTIRQLLAKVPADRPESAGKVSTRLARIRPTITEDRVATAPRLRMLALGIALTILAVATGLLEFWRGVNPQLLVILPFVANAGSIQGAFRESDCAILLDNILTGWADLPKVDRLRARSSVASHGAPQTLPEAEAIAHSVGAGRLLWGEVLQAGDSVRVHAVLYQVGRFESRTLGEYTIGLPLIRGRMLDDSATTGVVIRSFQQLARHLIATTLPQAATIDESLETASFAALRAKLTADSLLAAWDLDHAREYYREAIAKDPGYPQAHLSLAQLGAWTDQPGPDWATHAEIALRDTTHLTRTQRKFAAALLALAHGRAAEACERYRSVIAEDSVNFTAWFGLGECLASDRAVVPSSASPSGWTFQTSYASAMSAYRRALELVPLAHLAFSGTAITHLLDRFFVEPNHFRLGEADQHDTLLFGAFPLVAGDTLGFVPRPLSAFLGDSWPSEHPPAAMAVGQRDLLAVTHTWILSLPRSQAAWRAHAIALEVSGMLGSGNDPVTNALGAVLRSRSLEGGKGESIDLAGLEVRILVKMGRFAEASSLADSLLDQTTPIDDAETALLAGLAGLTGRASDAIRLLRLAGANAPLVTWDGIAVDPPSLAREDAASLLGYATLRVLPESATAVLRRLRSLVRQHPHATEERLWNGLTDRAVVHGFPALGAPAGRGGLRDVEQAISAGELEAGRAQLRRLRDRRLGFRAGDRGIDGALLEARLELLLADTAAARRDLDDILDNLSTLGRDLITDFPQAVAVPGALKLRVSLDPSPATSRWRPGRDALLRHADPVFLPR